MANHLVRVSGHRIELSHLDKLLFPDAGVSKADVIHYYRTIARVMLRHIRERPLTLQRFPDGIEAEGFFQKDRPDYFPDWLQGVELSKENGTVVYVTADSAADLVYLANQGTIALHMALSRTDRIDYPDRLVFDLDPSDDDFGKVQRIAKILRRMLEDLGLPSFVQTTGSRGLHIVVPIKRTLHFEPVREFAKAVARRLATDHPESATLASTKSERGNRVLIDCMRNAYGQTMVAPYSLRAKPGAPVATPIDWKEAGGTNLTPNKYTIRNILRRLPQKPDPWGNMNRRASSLDKAIDRFERM